MLRIQTFAMKRPLVFTIVILVLFILLMVLAYPIMVLAGAYGEAIAKLVIAVIVIAVLASFTWLRRSGLTVAGNKTGWLTSCVLLMLLIPIQLYAFTGGIGLEFPAFSVLRKLILVLFIGSFLEEVLFRGLIFSVMLRGWQSKKHGSSMALFGSSFAFGIIHFMNVQIRSIDVVLMQVFAMILVGIMYGALVLLSQSIWPAVIIHWLTNLVVNLKISTRAYYQETIWMWLIFIAGLVPILVFLLLWVKHKNKQQEY